MVGREEALRVPFRDLPYAEDRAFVLDCVMAGYSIAYLSTASVAYQQPAGFRHFYRIGRAAAVSRQLIREFGSEAIGTGLRESGLVRKGLKLVLKTLGIVGRTAEALLRDRPAPGRRAR